jgi:hypothetical protein
VFSRGRSADENGLTPQTIHYVCHWRPIFELVFNFTSELFFFSSSEPGLKSQLSSQFPILNLRHLGIILPLIDEFPQIPLMIDGS